MVNYEFKVRIFLEIIKYYNRLIKMDHSRLTYKVFENDLQNIIKKNCQKSLCFFCDEMEIEDEIHFGAECPRYQTYRDNFFTYICRNVSKKFYE